MVSYWFEIASVCILLVSYWFVIASVCVLLISYWFEIASICILLVSYWFEIASVCILLVSYRFEKASICILLVSYWFEKMLIFMPPPLGVGGIKFYPCTYVRTYVRQFSSKISPLVYVGLIWYLVWSIIMVSCTVSPLFRSVVYLLPVCRAGASVSPGHVLPLFSLYFPWKSQHNRPQASWPISYCYWDIGGPKMATP